MPTFRATLRHSGQFGIGKLTVAQTSKIKPNVTIDLAADVSIGEEVEIQDEVMIFTHKHFWNHSRGLRKEIEKIVPVNLEIGNDVFIGVRAMIIGVSSIGEGAVIGAGSVLTHDVNPFEVWAGNPARKVGERSA